MSIRRRRGAAPVDHHVVDAQPDAVVVGNLDPADARFRGEDAGDVADPHRAAGRGKKILDEAGQEAVAPVLFLRVGCAVGGAVLAFENPVFGKRLLLLREHHDRGQQEQAGNDKIPSQNACPMPM